jgi:glyoxylase-like metal-dependent hydrolase (beta-lactamase superfamily II)
MSICVHRIFSPMATTYLVESESGLVLIDAGLPGHERRVLRRMQSLGRDDLVLIFITHAHLDHYGSAATLRRLTGAPIAIHRADGETMAQGKTPIRSARNRGRLVLPFMPLIEAIVRLEPTPPDVVLDDGDNLRSRGIGLDFDAVVLHTPGHTPGSSCLIVEGRLAFVGDLISTAPRTTVQKFFADDWSLIPESLARLQALRPEWVYSGHGYHPLGGEKVQRMTCRG